MMKIYGKEENEDKIDNPTDIYVAELKADFIANCVHDGHLLTDVKNLVDEGCWSLDKLVMFERLNNIYYLRDQKAKNEKLVKEKNSDFF